MEKWQALEAEYVSGHMTYAELAEKHQIPLSTLCNWGRAGAWVEKRRRHQAGQDAAPEPEPADPLEALRQAAGHLCRAAAEMLSDPEQLHLYLTERKEKSRTPQGETERRILEQTRLDKVDLKALGDMVDVLKSLTAVTRELYGQQSDGDGGLRIVLAGDTMSFAQ